MVYVYHSFLIHSSADGHLGCFRVLTIVNSAAMNIGVYVSLSDLVSSMCMTRRNSQFLQRWIDTEIYENVYMYMGAYILIFPNCPLREPRSNETAIAVSKPGTQILISK